MSMSGDGWTHIEDANPTSFPDRRSVDLIGTKTIVTSSGFGLGVAWYTAEEFGEPQLHDDQEAIYVISGEGEFRLGDEVVTLSPGTAIYVPPGTPHGARRISEDPVVVVYTHGMV